MAKGKSVELRSDELHDILGKVSPWILRCGLTLIAVTVILLLAGSWFFKYPEIVTSTMTLTGTMPPAAVVAKNNGRLMTIYTKDNQAVKKDDILAIIENPASIIDMTILKGYVERILRNPKNIEPISKKDLELGNVQQYYHSLVRVLDNYERFKKLNYYPQKISAIEDRITASEDYHNNLKKQTRILEQQHKIAGRQFSRDSILYSGEAISGADIDNSQTQYLQNKLNVESSYSSLDNMKIQIKQTHESLLDTKQQYTDQLITFESEINNLAIQLMNEIKTWEMNYLLTSSIDGIVTFNSYWSENQNVKAGEVVFTVVPMEEGELIGKAQLPMQRSGKVKVGQKVNVRFLNFPENEFGIVKGEVRNISKVPIEGNYTLQITFPNGLITTYKKNLPFSQEMQAQADIVTDDMRLIERMFMPIKRIFSENLSDNE